LLVSSGWSVSVEFPGTPTRSAPPIVEEPCAEVTATKVSPSGHTTVRMFVEAGDEEDARARGLLVAGKVARNLGLPDTPQNVTLEWQRTFL
jgi:hypothetical protein